MSAPPRNADTDALPLAAAAGGTRIAKGNGLDLSPAVRCPCRVLPRVIYALGPAAERVAPRPGGIC